MSEDNETVGDVLKALVRTVVPVIAGYLLGLAALAGLGVPTGASAMLELLLTTVFTAAYYALIRWLSARWSWVGWLLGYPTNPTYVPRYAAD